MDQYWLEVAVDTTPECLDDLAAYLTGCGIVGLVLESEADFDRQLEEGRPYWDDVDEELRASWRGISRVKFYVTQDEDGEARLAEVQSGLAAFRGRVDKDAGTLAVTTVSLREEDWAENWKQYYQPFPVGDRLYVVPEWMRGEALPEGRTPLYLNPGLIFGTGSHGTTRLCLEGVERYVEPGDRVLDLGTGSGILAIAALLLGAKEAVGCDIDPKAARVAAENASYNGVEESFRVYTGDVNRDQKLKQALAGQYQLVLANIIADVIIPLAAVAGDYLAPGGRFLTSGIIESRAADVAAALTANGFVIVETRTREGWVSYTARKEV
ncbi:MAG: 50S ribosomal protein L11 methyltransferase [Clostridiales bacterium]|jgi:ribosomal protein L11 methyltransferase|nr:50S ribosomal protein L11 methyltransferase [Oscillospiraceae bacterium]PWL91161.1 MAG: 50S ribosomal protein L11 methyltransferase [Clostridiales bacterium]